MSTVVVTAVGFLLLWHGAVYLESAERAGEAGNIYLAEVVAGSTFLWPVSILGWVSYWATGEKGELPVFLFLILQGSGYFALYLLYRKAKRKRT